MPPNQYLSYVMRDVLELSALRDDEGRPYEDLPCMAAPYAWDEEQPIKIRKRAAQICANECPALLACRAQLRRVGGYARGVWAGEILDRRLPVAARAHHLPDLPPSPLTIVSS